VNVAHLLYRGVNSEFYEAHCGQLQPKLRSSFTRSPEFGQDEWGNCYWGDSPLNAVVEHQRHQVGYPTSGVSTTPHFERAHFYATRGGELLAGFIYVIDTKLCTYHDVTLYVVNDVVPQPSVVVDDEVILVAKDFGVIPSAVIVDVIRFGA
jgi:hypothetical protein